MATIGNRPSLPLPLQNADEFAVSRSGNTFRANFGDIVAQSTARDAWITSTTSFYECTHPTGINDNFGVALDGLHSNISSYTNEQAVTTRITSNGPLFGVSFLKANNNYYGGILFGYYGDVVLAFKYSNGTYSIRFL